MNAGFDPRHLSFLHFPETHGAAERLRLRLLTGTAARRADHVLTDSECVKNDLAERYGVPASRITVTPLAVERDVFRPPGEEERRELRQRAQLVCEYLLHVGTLHPRKNVGVLIEAMARQRARGRRVPPPLDRVRQPGGLRPDVPRIPRAAEPRGARPGAGAAVARSPWVGAPGRWRIRPEPVADKDFKSVNCPSHHQYPISKVYAQQE